jgi:hypothetical protein
VAKKKEEKTSPRRTEVKVLPQRTKKLSKDEQQKVKGGDDITSVEYDARGLAVGRGIRVRST